MRCRTTHTRTHWQTFSSSYSHRLWSAFARQLNPDKVKGRSDAPSLIDGKRMRKGLGTRGKGRLGDQGIEREGMCFLQSSTRGQLNGEWMGRQSRCIWAASGSTPTGSNSLIVNWLKLVVFSTSFYGHVWLPTAQLSKSKEIMRMVASVRPSICLSHCFDYMDIFAQPSAVVQLQLCPLKPTFTVLSSPPNNKSMVFTFPCL